MPERPTAARPIAPVLQPVPASAQGGVKADAALQGQARGTAASPSAEKVPPASPADVQLEEKVRAALGARIAAGGELTITYAGEVVEKPAGQAAGAAKAATPPAAKAGSRP